jgi:acyl-CoA synthetase (AMP-forming)/AMP-acid ligase II/acyl carrier protein
MGNQLLVVKMFPKSSYRFATIPNLLSSQAARIDIACALKSRLGEQLSYQQLNERVCKIVNQLRSMGIGPRARVGIVVPNGLNMSVTLLAVTSASIAAPLNPSYREFEFQSYLDEIQVDCIITIEGGVSPVRAVAKNKGIPIVELASDGVTLSANPEIAKAMSDRDKALQGDVQSQPKPDDTALILLTSGSTGRSKKVPLTHRNLCSSVADICHSLQLDERDICLSAWEQFHIGGVTDLLLAPLASGGEIICTGGFNADEFFAILDELSPTWFQGVPTTLHEILAVANKTGRSSSKTSLRFIRSVASALPPQLMERIEAFFQVPVVQTYGMTEAGPLIASNPLPPGVRKAGSTGPSCGTLISIRGADGRELGPHETGEILIKGENVVAGYEGDEDELKKAWCNGWFVTGDTGYLDSDGYLFLKGRTKEQINRGGEKIVPQEIDDVLLTHPDIEQAASFSVKHPTLGEDVGVAVVIRHGSNLDAQAIRRFVAGRLSDFKVPKTVLLLSTLPRSVIGKVNRDVLASLAKSQNNDLPFEPPKTELQKLLVKIWAEELGVERMSLDDDFAKLGGDSLSYVRLFLAMERLFGVNLDSTELDDNLTVRKLATLIEALPDHVQILARVAELDKNPVFAQSSIEKVLSSATAGTPDREHLATAQEMKEALLKCDTANEFDALLESFYTELTPDELAPLGGISLSSSDLQRTHAQRFLSAKEFIRDNVAPLTVQQNWRRQRLSECVRLYTSENTVKKNLIVGFAGHLFRLMMPMWTLLSHLNSTDTGLLLLWDPARKHYSGGIPGLSDNFPGLLKPLDEMVSDLKYDRVVGFGTSAGGLPALCAGLANGWDSTVSVNAAYPLTKKHLFPVLKSLSEHESVTRRPKIRLYYSELNQGDLLAAVAIAKIAKGEIRPLIGHSHHSHVLWAAYEKGELPKLFSEFFT